MYEPPLEQTIVESLENAFDEYYDLHIPPEILRKVVRRLMVDVLESRLKQGSD
jgi:hypothetical protein